MERELDDLARKASDIHGRMVTGARSEFERHRLMRDMMLLANGLRTAAGRARELSNLIVSLGDDQPRPPGGRAA